MVDAFVVLGFGQCVVRGGFPVRRRSLSSHRAARARASHLTGRVALLSWLCAFVRVQVIRSRGAWLGQVLRLLSKF